MIDHPAYGRTVHDALQALGVRRLALGIHDASFPSADDDDTGRGSPYSPAGFRFLRFARELGFNGIQLGPQGQTPEESASPYDGTIFSRNLLSISLARLTDPQWPWAGILSRDVLRAMVDARPDEGDQRVPYAHVYRVHHEALRRAFATFEAETAGSTADAVRHLRESFDGFKREEAAWLERDVSHERLRGTEGAELEFHRFGQFVAHEQHRLLREELREFCLELYGDLQIGFSDRDAWTWRGLFLPGYVMGAPPSRTNPRGQPWHYPVLDPGKYHREERPGPVLELISSRMDKMFAEFDAVRIDHPHGLVCPWVYRADEHDPTQGVQRGARLLSSPDLPDHPDLARYAIPTREQLNPDPTCPRYADEWVVDLTPEQVGRYALLFDELVRAAHRNGRQATDLICEVLSTMPYPLGRVLERHGLGRFRVTQKADLHDSEDVYRSENARPADWVMIGNHDTKPIWYLIDEWQQTDQFRSRAEYLAERLIPEADQRPAFVKALIADPGLLAQAQLGDLFASRAENVMIFFTDLFGLTETYNVPGMVAEENWSLRLARTYQSDYRDRVARNRALNLPLALGLALRAAHTAPTSSRTEALRALELCADELMRKPTRGLEKAR